MSMYIRVKRKNQTIFLYSDPAEKVSQTKDNLAKITEVSADELGLIFNDKQLDNDSTIGDNKIENDNVVYLVYKDGDGWEDVDVQETTAMTEEDAS
mmetsp:Transcript_227/g.261  ORF Transcript_227/g.261 Transcript_227/m.261 type:complete len:96 (+) Transcript_227:54-341(+)|eukprot:CAMPEP_0174250084 /NCGR_PEP_ID=MMETSP0439-20130205/371_1 /TAXON_ID=0 /ORGANISM="Stereomyxa ramosa, Strain Chinc5" /LENGTH=95 /DNA_ID=CAMNT_0015330071 /DNA_START=75 /DNA_END=362 /DNA_ORIENTATION=+